LSRRVSETVEIAAAPETVFAHVDDFQNVGSHMTERSMAMVGNHLRLDRLSENATGVGARYRWHGRIAGLTVDLTEVVTEWVPNRRKVWETVGQPRLIIMSGYRMSFTVAPTSAGTVLTITIEYERPGSLVGRVLGWLLGDAYSRWCLRRMCRDARKALEKGRAPAGRR
jgi:uncharacterized membrane protein